MADFTRYKTVNPSFNIEILIQRFLSDISNFYYENKFSMREITKIEGENINNEWTIAQLIENVKDIKTQENKFTIENIKNTIVNYIIDNIKQNNLLTFNYLDYVSRLNDETEKNIFWILRTILFYLLLMYATLIFQNDDLTNYIEENKIETFRTELSNFHLGIFGSLTPTSDIDVGIRYVGKIHNLCVLNFIVLFK